MDVVRFLDPAGRTATAPGTARAVPTPASPRASFVTGTDPVADGALTRGVQL